MANFTVVYDACLHNPPKMRDQYLDSAVNLSKKLATNPRIQG